MLRLPPLLLLAGLLSLLIIGSMVSDCAAKRAPVLAVTPDGYQTFGFAPAPGFFAERDVQYIDGKPHCILRLPRAANPNGQAAYLEVSMEWCEGIE